MEKIRSLVGMVSKKKFFSACKCYENNKYGVDYVKPQLCIDEESHLIFCDRCGAVIDPFAAMLMVAMRNTVLLDLLNLCLRTKSVG